MARESVKVPKKQCAKLGTMHRIFQEKGSPWDETLERSSMDAEGAMQSKRLLAWLQKLSGLKQRTCNYHFPKDSLCVLFYVRKQRMLGS